jgi:hypothetical protein
MGYHHNNKIHLGVRVKCTIFLPDFNQVWISLTDFHFFVAPRPKADHDHLIFEVSRSHTTTQHSQYDSSGRVISSSHRPLPDNTQHSQQTNIHAPGWIQTHDLSRRAAADLSLRARGYWDRPTDFYKGHKYQISYKSVQWELCWYMRTDGHDTGVTEFSRKRERATIMANHINFYKPMTFGTPKSTANGVLF